MVAWCRVRIGDPTALPGMPLTIGLVARPAYATTDLSVEATVSYAGTRSTPGVNVWGFETGA